MIDLHSHSFYSDGVLSPEKLVSLAIAAKLEFLALTDHDTVEGLKSLPLMEEIKLIPGIEVSTSWNNYDVHIIGLNIDPQSEALLNLIDKQAQRRVDRAHKISTQLATVGIEDAYSKAYAVAGHKRIGRPHFAQVMIDEGKAATTKEAFKKFLLKGGVGYVASDWANLTEAVAVINAAGGQAIIAHPKRYKMDLKTLERLIQDFKQAGGQALEVVSGVTDARAMRQMAGMCLKYDLWASSGSDFHGKAYALPLGGQAKLPAQCKPIWHQWN